MVKNLKRKEERARDTTHRALTFKETDVFFSEAAESAYYNVYRMGISTGMRIGEIGALYYSDIYDGLIHVERTVTRDESGGFVIGEDAKTRQGRRTIPLNSSIKDIIESQKAANEVLYGSATEIKETLFKAPDGGLLSSSSINREIDHICDYNRIEKFTFHALRATFATRLIEAGVNPRTVQELLGHADYAITMNLYGHVVDDTKKDAMEKIGITLKI